MISSYPAEAYAGKLLDSLEKNYGLYISELLVIRGSVADSPVEVLETFINIEQHRFQQIASVEKVLKTHLRACSEPFLLERAATLNHMRHKAQKVNSDLRLALKERMSQIRNELSSIRFPGRAKNYRQESVPVLIDIET